MAGIFHKIKQIAQKIGQGANWVGQHIYQPIKPFINVLAPPIVSKGLQVTSSGLDAIYANNAQDGIINLANFKNDVGNFIDEPSCGTYIIIREIEEAIADQVSIPCTMPIRFRLSIPLNDILVFSGITDYYNSLFGDHKIKFKINPNTFVFAQVNPIISMAKYYTMNKTDLMAGEPEKLKNIDLLFRNWSLVYQYTKLFTQMGCTADLITKIRIEQITDSGLKNLSCSVSPVTLSIKNYVITEVTANMSGYKATEDCLQRVREFYANRPFVIPSQRVDAWSFQADARANTCYENPCYHNIQVTTCGTNFPETPTNTLDQQFFQIQLNTSNLDLLFKATDKFEDALTISRSTASRRLNPRTDLTSFMITLQCERNSYVGKRPPSPILCTIHDTFWLFEPANGGQCIYDFNNTFDEMICQIEG
ncbi:MAG: hypothetical protein EZS28_017270 [Streblomastix strix]|uniref:Uncharacterized protein n=1 Tax=Streblomastix strix TaxID=222440 RepID=A0A5J4VWW4_9EUKA|nr:MAG: hypothetical protein EZS28_017270 [Streblomastix strix]